MLKTSLSLTMIKVPKLRLKFQRMKLFLLEHVTVKYIPIFGIEWYRVRHIESVIIEFIL